MKVGRRCRMRGSDCFGRARTEAERSLRSVSPRPPAGAPAGAPASTRARPRIACTTLLVLAACGGAAAAPAPEQRAHHAHHDFHDAAAWAQRFDDPARDAWQKPDEVVALLQLQPGMTVADLGAGTGYFEPYLSRAVGERGRVLGLDVEPSMVAYLRDRATREGLANVESRQVAPDDPGLAPGSVDRVVIVDTWHHLSDRPGYARKLAAALAPGGTVTIVDFNVESKMGPPPAEKIPPERAADELRSAGLRAEIVPEGLPEQYVVRASRVPGFVTRGGRG